MNQAQHDRYDRAQVVSEKLYPSIPTFTREKDLPAEVARLLLQAKIAGRIKMRAELGGIAQILNQLDRRDTQLPKEIIGGWKTIARNDKARKKTYGRNQKLTTS